MRPLPAFKDFGMATSKTEIANLALLKLGKNPITNIEDTNDHHASIIRQSWDILRDSELRNYAWLFAIKRLVLPALADPPAFGYNFAYQLPADFLRMVSINGEAAPYDPAAYNPAAYMRWVVENGKVLTDYPSPVQVRYVARVENTFEWDASFVELFACRLAAELTQKVNGSGTDRQLAWREYMEARAAAYKNNAIETDTQTFPDGAFVAARVM